MKIKTMLGLWVSAQTIAEFKLNTQAINKGVWQVFLARPMSFG